MSLHHTLTISLLLLAASILTTVSGQADATEAQQAQTSIGIDANPAGNTGTNLETIDECVSMRSGETKDIDIFVEDVDDLLAWEMVLTFEPGVLEIVGGDVQFLLATTDDSNVQDVSGELPDSDGRYQLAAFDAADPAAPESGSGLLARVSVKAVGPGISPLGLPQSDLDDDGNPDEGPLLRDTDANAIGDENGDTLFDGTIIEASVAVDETCEGVRQTEAEPEANDGGLSGVAVAGIVIGSSAAALVAAGIGWLALRRRKQRSQ